MLSECHKIGWDVHRVVAATASCAVGRAFGAAMAVTLLLIGGCTQTVRESSEVGDQRMRRPTRVISSTPRGDEQTLREAEARGDLTGRLALMEEAKGLPWGAVWDAYCERMNAPVGEAWLNDVRGYETKVLAVRA